MSSQSDASRWPEATPCKRGIIDYPKGSDMEMPDGAPILTAQQVATTIRCLISDDAPRKLTLHHTSGVKGDAGNQWCEASSIWEGGHYRWQFLVRDKLITACFRAKTPKGATYDTNRDGGNPVEGFSEIEQYALSNLLLPATQRSIEVVKCWIVCVTGARPFAAMLHYSEEEAMEYAEQQRKLLGLFQSTEDPNKTAKEKTKLANSIAFKGRKRK